MTEPLRSTLASALADQPLLDVHTHLDAAHLAARGLHDVLLYHMVISDLGSAGCPSRGRLSENPTDAEAEARIVEALPYLPYIANTSCAWGLRVILREIYDWTEPIAARNWRRLDELIRARAHDPAWPREILRRARVQRVGTLIANRGDGSADDICQYALEWAFFTRSQWGLYDIPLFELERAWNQEEPGAPLSINLGADRPTLGRTISTLDDVKAAMTHYVEHIPYGQVLSTATHISTDIDFRSVTDSEMAAALARRDHAGPAERDVYASYVQEAYLTELERHADEIVFQFSFGAEPLPFETGSKLRQESIFQLAAMLERHPRLRFQVFLASAHTNQALCTLARELPNLTLVGYWWHNFFPGFIRQMMGERLDMLPTNRQIGFFSDAYCVEWTYAKASLVRRQLVEVLAQRVEQGQYSVDDALAIARAILYDTPQSALGIKPAQV